MKSFTCSQEEKLSRMIMKEYDGEMSFSVFQKLLRKKDIKINGVRVKADEKVKAGDKVEVYYDGVKPSCDYRIIYKDSNIVAVYKPKGITSEKFFEILKNEYSDLYFCHRLDRNTDGVMVFALNENSYNDIVDGFKRRTFKKIYRATVYGCLKKDNDIMTAYLVKDAENSFVKVFDKPQSNSVKIITAYSVVNRDNDSTTVEVELVTGRTHQIRAHFAHIGHFILGDGKYGDERINKSLNVKEMMLSSISLTLYFDKESKLYSTLNGLKLAL